MKGCTPSSFTTIAYLIDGLSVKWV